MVELIPVTEAQKPVLARLLELYEYEFSQYLGSDVDENGLFGYPYLDCYWKDPDRYAYFIRVNGTLAGFAMVCGWCYAAKEPGTHSMAEFFVMHKYRRCGIGTKAAAEVFRAHRGKWELCVHPANTVSHPFWEGVIKSAAADVQVMQNVKGVYDNASATVYLFEVK